MKTPLQAVVSVICDALCELPSSDQVRAIEAVRVTLGLREPAPPAPDRNPYRGEREPLPRVEVQMMGDRAVVVNQGPQTDTPDRRQNLVVAGPQRTSIIRPRQLPAPSTRAPAARRDLGEGRSSSVQILEVPATPPAPITLPTRSAQATTRGYVRSTR